MNYEEFCACVKTRVQELKGEDASVSIQKNLKNNGQEYAGLLIRDQESNIMPALYLEAFYREYECGTCFEDVLEKILVTYEEYQWRENMDLDFFYDFQQAKDNIVFKLINQKENERLLKKIPWIPMLDLAMVFYCMIPDRGDLNATIPIDLGHLKLWNVETELLYEYALKNTPKLLPFKIEPIRNVLEKLLEQREEEIPEEVRKEEEENPYPLQGETEVMFVLSNNCRIFGAACLFYPGVLRKFSKEVEKDLFVLPSSIHEVLLIPDDGSFLIRELEALVKSVNSTQVEREEQLSDSVYRYCWKTDRISIGESDL